MRITRLAFLLVACSAPDVEFACEAYACVEEPVVGPTVGDADAGWEVMLNGDYMKQGVPLRLYQEFSYLLGDTETLPGRTGDSAGIPYDYTVGTSVRGVKVVSFGCLNCHAGRLNGELMVGLGNSLNGPNSALGLVNAARALTSDPAEDAELDLFAEVLAVMDPYSPDTRGMSAGPPSMMGVAARRDPVTSAWLDEDHMAPAEPVPYNVPAWWNTKYKRSAFANTAARGDFAYFQMNPAHVVTETPDAMADVLALAPDVMAWILSLEAPEWPWDLDRSLAKQGRAVFEDTCATCHGTYRGKVDYPNVVVPIEVIGTDSWDADQRDAWQRSWDEHFVDNPFGQGLEWAPQAGYAAPPLVGVWATAPYFHNGSVPTLAGVIDSQARPDIWRRASLDSDDYDPIDVGWSHLVLDVPKDDLEDDDERFEVYDTSHRGYANTGHTFGDALGDDDRRALLEYLKTL